MTLMRPVLVLVGGFLGAGKTTWMLAAAERLRQAGHAVGVITNDQGEQLVDTELARSAGLDAEQIAGGCFCCRFSELIASADRLAKRAAPLVIFAEPVGSCTDLAATVLRPIQRLFGERYRVAPLTVLVDPRRATRMLAASNDVSYLFRKQIGEADIVLFSRADQYGGRPVVEGIQGRAVSALTGQGLAEWLDEVLSEAAAPGERTIEVDYARYGAAEAALGWLNWQFDLKLRRPLTTAAIVGPLLERLDREVPRIAHLKVFGRSLSGYVKAGICENGEEPSVAGRLDTPPETRHEIVLNLRAEAPPELLDSVVERAVASLPGRCTVRFRQSFRPAAPRPEMGAARPISENPE